MAKFVCVKDFEDHFERTQAANIRSYFLHGSERQVTRHENEDAFKRTKILPRVMRDVSHRDLSTTLLGETISFPVGVAPTGGHGYLWRGGEAETFKGAAAANTCCVHSTYSNCTLAEVLEKAPPGVLPWFQLYMMSDRDYSAHLVKEAERLGYKALVLTVDAFLMGLRWASMRHPLPSQPHNPFKMLVRAKAPKRDTRGVPLSGIMDQKMTWNDITWLRSLTRMPIVIKGILSPEDAALAVQYGASAVWVSNHGGRQVDTVPSALEMLPAVVRAVNGKAEVYMDGGVRTGSDVFKALALGAKAVFIGGPAQWGLAAKGADGVQQVLDILRDEFNTCMALSGCRKISDIDDSYILKPSKL